LSRFLPNIDLQFKPGTTNGAANASSCSPVEEANVLLVCVTDETDDVLIKEQNEQRKDEGFLLTFRIQFYQKIQSKPCK